MPSRANKGVTMDNTQPKANWVQSRDIIENQVIIGRVYISDKGALKFVKVDVNNVESFLFCLMPQHLPYAMNFDLAGLIQSQEYQAIREEAAKNKERTKLERKVASQQQRTVLKLQSLLEEAKSLGIDLSKVPTKAS